MIRTEKIKPHSNCPTCHKLEDIEVYISAEAHEFIRQESANAKDVETGGVLIGHRTLNGKYFISRSTGPGPRAIKTKTRFEKDKKYCQKELENAQKKLGNKGLYLGEWHYHSICDNSPSGLDIKSLTEIANQRNYRIDKPIMIIISPSLECVITIHDKNGQCVQLPLAVKKSAEFDK